jgi:hypothetical protein
MKLSILLAQRQSLLQQARLANLAFAYERLSVFTSRIAYARLSGEVRLQHLPVEGERAQPSLTALQGSQSVIEEHFTEEDLVVLCDVIAYTTGESEIDITFRIEELVDRLLTPLRERLEQAGIVFDIEEEPLQSPDSDDTSDYSHADEES